MAITLFILILLAAYHFVYESIILPTERLDLRYKLFKERDNLRILKMNDKDGKITDDIFKLLDTTICNSIDLLPQYTISLFYNADKELRLNKNLRAKVEKRNQLIEGYEVEEIKEIGNNVYHHVGKAFLLNFGSWIVYLLPFLILIILYAVTMNKIERVKTQIKAVSFTPNYEFEGMLTP